MKSDPLRLRDLLEHVAHAIDRINKYTEAGEADFLNNEMAQDAVIRNFEVLGEASRNLEKRFPDFANENPDLPLRNAYEMRNALTHGYFKVDLVIVWKTIESDLPTLKTKIEKVLERLEES